MMATEHALSEIDGEAGRLVVRGRPIEDLAGCVSYETVVGLLWQQSIDGLAQARLRVWDALRPRTAMLSGLSAMDGLRVGLSLLSTDQPLDLVAAVAVITAVQVRLAAGQAPMAPQAGVSHAEDFVRMAGGREAPALDGYWVTVAEHGLNASTYTARVVASTQAGLRPAVVAALCALQGPLHGGAPGPVLDMLDAIGQPDRARAWLEHAVQDGQRLMGFGHRIYRVRDPRADALQSLVAGLQHEGKRLALARAVEGVALDVLARHKPGRSLQTNVEFYTAVLLEAAGIPRPFFTSVFACGRVAGWLAHAMEQVQSGRLIRPTSL